MSTSIYFYVYNPICIKVRMSDMKPIMIISPMRKTVRDNARHPQQTNLHAPGGIWTRNPNKRTATDPRLTPTLQLAATGSALKMDIFENNLKEGNWFY
jgi:hypothetical protein